MTENYNIGDKVKRKWGEAYGEGKISQRFAEKVTRSIDGTEVTRNASDDEPAFLIEQEDGGRVLKSRSEWQRAG